MKKLLALCQIYFLLIGLTSYRLVNERFRQTRMTQIYAWTVNIILLAVLPYCLWLVSIYAAMFDVLPRGLEQAHFVLNPVNYTIIVYIVASRRGRDRVLLDLQKLTIQLDRARTQCGTETSLKLRKLLCLKIFTVAYQALANILVPFVFEFQRGLHLISVILNFGYHILMGSSLFYFVSFWHIAQGYHFINRSIEELITGLKSHSISHMWKMHMNLSRTARKINGCFQTQMLALRLNHFIFSVMDFYVVVLFLRRGQFPWYFFYFGAILHLIRLLDFYLNDYIIDLTVEYHNMRRDSVTEGTMSEELEAFILYGKSMKLDLMVCGLFKANRNNWLRMTEGILCHVIVLMQFRLTSN